MDSREQQFLEECSWYEWYNALVLAIPPLTPDEYSTAIASLSATKDSAEYRAVRERLITSHLREILSMAKDRQHYRLPIADYVGIGNLGVVKHFDEFAPDRGAFSEFVRITILKAILDGNVPDTFSLKKLRGNIPDDWEEQRRKFGFPVRN